MVHVEMHLGFLPLEIIVNYCEESFTIRQSLHIHEYSFSINNNNVIIKGEH